MSTVPPFADRAKAVTELQTAVLKGMSALIIGEPGVGKSSMLVPLLGLPKKNSCLTRVEHVATKTWLVESSGNSSIVEERVRSLLLHNAQEPGRDRSPPTILFVDDVDVLFSLSLSLENLFRKLLLGGQILTVCTCSYPAYKRRLCNDAVFDERFTLLKLIWLEPSSESETEIILRAHDKILADKYAVKIVPEALAKIARLANKFCSHRNLPDSAVDLLTEACILASGERHRTVTSSTAQAVISQWGASRRIFSVAAQDNQPPCPKSARGCKRV